MVPFKIQQFKTTLLLSNQLYKGYNKILIGYQMIIQMLNQINIKETCLKQTIKF